MTSPASDASRQKSLQPVRQHLRIAALRLCFIALLPTLLMVRPLWPAGSPLREALETAGTLLVFAAVLGRFWAIMYIGGHKNRKVMDQGPYSLCRHPLYLASTVGVAGFGLMLGSVTLTVLLVAVFFTILTVTALYEERFLRAELGAAYGEYAGRVPRLLPDPRGFATEPAITVNLSTLRKNLVDALVFLALLPAAKIIAGLDASVWLPQIVLF